LSNAQTNIGNLNVTTAIKTNSIQANAATLDIGSAENYALTIATLQGRTQTVSICNGDLCSSQIFLGTGYAQSSTLSIGTGDSSTQAISIGTGSSAQCSGSILIGGGKKTVTINGANSSGTASSIALGSGGLTAGTVLLTGNITANSIQSNAQMDVCSNDWKLNLANGDARTTAVYIGSGPTASGAVSIAAGASSTQSVNIGNGSTAGSGTIAIGSALKTVNIAGSASSAINILTGGIGCGALKCNSIDTTTAGSLQIGGTNCTGISFADGLTMALTSDLTFTTGQIYLGNCAAARGAGALGRISANGVGTAVNFTNVATTTIWSQGSFGIGVWLATIRLSITSSATTSMITIGLGPTAGTYTHGKTIYPTNGQTSFTVDLTCVFTNLLATTGVNLCGYAAFTGVAPSINVESNVINFVRIA
jgi:hypothetical protein